MLGMSMPLLMNIATVHHLKPLTLGLIWTFSASK
jgi:hypothetical protein